MLSLTASILQGDAREALANVESSSVQTCVTSPPYWKLRDYDSSSQLGQEETPEAFVENLVRVFDEVGRTLRDDGTLWVNLGDSYSGKSLVGIPWLFAFAMKARGWFLRQDVIWSKPNPMPESVVDRCAKSHEYLFLFAKQERYKFNSDAIREPLADSSVARLSQNVANQSGSTRAHGKAKTNGPMKASGNPLRGRLKRSVWTIPTASFKGAHFAVFPPNLVSPCVLAGSDEGDLVLDPFTGSGTTGLVALNLQRRFVGCELNPDFAELARERMSSEVGLLGNVEVTACSRT